MFSSYTAIRSWQSGSWRWGSKDMVSIIWKKEKQKKKQKRLPQNTRSPNSGGGLIISGSQRAWRLKKHRSSNMNGAVIDKVWQCTQRVRTKHETARDVCQELVNFSLPMSKRGNEEADLMIHDGEFHSFRSAEKHHNKPWSHFLFSTPDRKCVWSVSRASGSNAQAHTENYTERHVFTDQSKKKKKIQILHPNFSFSHKESFSAGHLFSYSSWRVCLLFNINEI